jgi:hypothetical protein
MNTPITPPKSASELIKETIVANKVTNLFAEDSISIEFSDEIHKAMIDVETKTIVFPYNLMFTNKDIASYTIASKVSIMKYIDPSLHYLVDTAVGTLIEIYCEEKIKSEYPSLSALMNRAGRHMFDSGFFGQPQLIVKSNVKNRLSLFSKLGYKNANEVGLELSVNELKLIEKIKNIDSTIESFNGLIEESNAISSEYVPSITIDDIECALSNGCIGNINPEDATPEVILDTDYTVYEDRLEDYLESIDVSYIIDSKMRTGNIKNIIALHKVYPSKEQYDAVMVKNQEYLDYIATKYPLLNTTAVIEYKKTFEKHAKSMALVFESKKAAHCKKFSKINETGLINVNRVVNYKFDDRIFLQKSTLGDAKDHAFIIMLDCSGSISSFFNALVDQTVLLVEFFRKINVKYKVIGFGACLFDNLRFNCERFNVGFSCNIAPGSIIEFLTSKQNKQEHNTSVYCLRNKIGFHLSHTPTNTAFNVAEHILKTEYANVQKRKLVIVTDGEPTDTNYLDYRKSSIMIDPVTNNIQPLDKSTPFSSIDVQAKMLFSETGIETYIMGIANSSMSQSKMASNMGLVITPQVKRTITSNKFCEFNTSPGVTYALVRPARYQELWMDDNVFEFDIKATVKNTIKRLNTCNRSSIFVNCLASNLAV